MAKASLASLILVLTPPSLALAADGPSHGTVVYPETPTTVDMSNRDINRLVCQGGSFEDYKFSGEKGIIVEASGADAFVKFQILEVGDDRQYVTARSEFFLKCGGAMFTVFARPRDIPSQTVFLGAPTAAAAKANSDIFNPLSDEERAIRITHGILKDAAPAGFSKTAFDEPYRDGMIAGADVRRRAHFQIEGSGFSGAEYLVRASRPVLLDEMMFARRAFGKAIYAVTIESPQLKAGEVTRAIVIYRGDGR
ncbi:MAG: type-F conjugative transfer system secretin TraK [Pseudomonadota bacterium]